MNNAVMNMYMNNTAQSLYF